LISSTFLKQLFCEKILKAQKDTDDLNVFVAILESVQVKTGRKHFMSSFFVCNCLAQFFCALSVAL